MTEWYLNKNEFNSLLKAKLLHDEKVTRLFVIYRKANSVSKRVVKVKYIERFIKEYLSGIDDEYKIEFESTNEEYKKCYIELCKKMINGIYNYFI